MLWCLVLARDLCPELILLSHIGQWSKFIPDAQFISTLTLWPVKQGFTDWSSLVVWIWPSWSTPSIWQEVSPVCLVESNHMGGRLDQESVWGCCSLLSWPTQWCAPLFSYFKSCGSSQSDLSSSDLQALLSHFFLLRKKSYGFQRRSSYDDVTSVTW